MHMRIDNFPLQGYTFLFLFVFKSVIIESGISSSAHIAIRRDGLAIAFYGLIFVDVGFRRRRRRPSRFAPLYCFRCHFDHRQTTE
jgi:hypothetical protein